MPGFWRDDKLWVISVPLDHSADKEILDQLNLCQKNDRLNKIRLVDIYRVAEGIERRCENRTDLINGMKVIIYPGRCEVYETSWMLTTAFVLEWRYGGKRYLNALDTDRNRPEMAVLDNPPRGGATEEWIREKLPEMVIPNNPLWDDWDNPWY